MHRFIQSWHLLRATLAIWFETPVFIWLALFWIALTWLVWIPVIHVFLSEALQSNGSSVRGLWGMGYLEAFAFYMVFNLLQVSLGFIVSVLGFWVLSDLLNSTFNAVLYHYAWTGKVPRVLDVQDLHSHFKAP